MTAHISVICPTMRVGGIDIICNSLRDQNFYDFELIIADNIYKYRKDIIEEKAKNYNFPIKHIEPFNNSFPNNAFCRVANSGLAHADCKIVLFITDYTWLPPDCLLKHASFHLYNPSMAYLGPHQYYQLKNVHPNFIPYTENDGDNDGARLYHHSNADTLKYAEDVKYDKYKNLMFSLFKNEFDNETYEYELDPLLANADPKLRCGSTFTNQMFFHAKNESIAFEHILKVNGWNEVLDQGYAHQDSDIFDRLNKFGDIKNWYVDGSNIARIINPRPIFPHGYRKRSVADNGKIFEEQKANNYPAKNSWNLREVNELNKMKDYYDQKLKNFKFD